MLSTAPDLVVGPSFMGNPILPTVVELLAAWTVHVSAHIRPKISKYVFPIETQDLRKGDDAGGQLTSSSLSLRWIENKL